METHGGEPTSVAGSRRHVGVTAAMVRARFLHPSMEATARNLEQFDPSPECDSLLEWAIVHIQAGRREQAIATIETAIRSNELEGDESRSISSTADQLCADLERMMVAQTLGIKALCRQLRPILKAIEHGLPHEVSAAIVEWREVHQTVPTVELSRPGVRRELGVKLSAVMDRLLTEVAA